MHAPVVIDAHAGQPTEFLAGLQGLRLAAEPNGGEGRSFGDDGTGLKGDGCGGERGTDNPSAVKALEKYLDVLLVLHLICPDEDEMVRRMRRRALKENRIDDADEKVIRRRFEVYRRETAPILNYYPANIIKEVPATGSPAMVLMSVLDVVAPLQDHHFRNPLNP